MAIPFKFTKARQGRDEGRMFGTLGSVGLNDIVQMLGMTKRTATLSLEHRGARGTIFFRDGVVLHVSALGVEGEDALLSLVEWTDADFTVEDGIPEGTKATIGKSVDAVLLDLMTRIDETKRTNVTPFPGRHAQQGMRHSPHFPTIAPPDASPFPKRLTAITGAVGLGVGLALSGYWLFGAAPQTAPVESEDTTQADAEAGASHPTGGVATPPAPEGTSIDGIALAPSMGFLTVNADEDARIYLSGENVGSTPLRRLAIAPGTHEVLLVSPEVTGAVRDTVTLEEGENLTRSYSFHDTGSLRVIVNPWANVYIDGRAVGETPMQDVTVPLGMHEVVLRHPSLGELTREVLVEEGETAIVKVSF